MEVIKVYEMKTQGLTVNESTILRWKKLSLTLISLSTFYLKCLGIHENVLGTKQNYQDTVPDFKNIQSSKLTLLNGHKQQNLQLRAFSQPDTTMVIIKFPSACGVVVENTRRSSNSKRNNKPNQQNLE